MSLRYDLLSLEGFCDAIRLFEGSIPAMPSFEVLEGALTMNVDPAVSYAMRMGLCVPCCTVLCAHTHITHTHSHSLALTRRSLPL
jgi:hypothetical protein